TVVATDYYIFNKIDLTSLTWSGGVASLGGTQQVTTLRTTSLPGKMRQPDGTKQISGADDDRYTGAVYQVGDLIYAAHGISVNSSGVSATASSTTHDAVHLVVLSASTNTIVAETTYFNNSYDYAYPSVAANAAGDIIMGLNRSGLGATDGQLGAYVV